MKIRYVITLLTLLTVGLTIVGRPAAPQQDAQRQKARHYFLAGSIADAQDNGDVAYEYYRKAFQTDSTFGEAAYHYSIGRLMNRLDTLLTVTEVDRSLERVKRFIDSNPNEIQEGLYYAYLAGYRGQLAEAARIYRRIDSLKPERTRTLLTLAEVEMAQRKWTDALKALEKYEAIEGENPEISLRKIQLLYRAKDTVQALDASNRLVGKYPQEPRYLLLRGNLYEELGDTAAMMADYLEAHRIAPTSGIVNLTLADAAIQRGDSAEYDRRTYQAILSEDYAFEEKMELLHQYLVRLIADSADNQRGDYLFAELQKQNPHSSELLNMEGEYRMAVKEYEKAVDSFSYAVDLDPENPAIWQRLMVAQIVSDNEDDAIRSFRRAEKSVTPDVGMMMMAAGIAISVDSLQTAEELIGRSLREILPVDDPTLPITSISPAPHPSQQQLAQLMGIYRTAGDLYHKKNDTTKAANAYRNALYIDDRDPLTLNNYAYFLAETDSNLEEALDMSRQAVEAVPDSPTNIDTYAWILHKLGRHEDALEEQEKAIKMGEEEDMVSSELYSHYAEILRAVGRSRDAQKAEAKAHELENKEKEKK